MQHACGQEVKMLKGLMTDAMVHFRECIFLNASLFVSFIGGICAYRRSDKKTNERMNALLLMTFVSFILLIIPLSASVIRMVFGTYYDAPDIWGILPLMPLGAVCMSALSGEAVREFDKDKKSTVIIGTALLICAYLACGSLGTSREQSSGRPEGATLSEREVSEYICEHFGGSVVVANDNITASLHTVSADIVTLYGRDMWDGRLTKNRYGTYSEAVRKLHDDYLKMEAGDFGSASAVCKDALAHGADIVVIPGMCDVTGFESQGLSYEIFTASSGENYYLISGGIL